MRAMTPWWRPDLERASRRFLVVSSMVVPRCWARRSISCSLGCCSVPLVMRMRSGVMDLRVSWTGLRPSTWIMGGLSGRIGFRGYYGCLIRLRGLVAHYFYLVGKWVLGWFGGFAGVLGVFCGFACVVFALEWHLYSY